MIVERIGSGGPWEKTIGYCRAVVAGGWVLTAGCTSTVDGAVTNDGDPYAQTTQAFQIALDALACAGAGPQHVIRTRMYVVGRANADAVGRAHGDLFRDVRPAATMVMVESLINPDHLVEVEVEAFLG